jgi:N-ethylmaleimide reductase
MSNFTVIDMTTTPLFTPARAGRLALANRIVMAPMTRLRATEYGTPTPEMAVYYAQRATAGLIVSEGIWPAPAGQSEWRVPGLSDDRHVAGWRTVTRAVHDAGGVIVAQLMHGGRNGHPRARIDGSVPAGPSAVGKTELVHLPDGSKAAPPVPRAMTAADIDRTIGEYAAAAVNALRAGFDGVEIHGANSYLPHQFLADNTNLRTDCYGGSVAGRIRFPLEVVRAVAEAVGPDRTGVRLSPGNPQFEMVERDPGPVYRALTDELDRLGLAYLHLTDDDVYPALADLRPRWSGTLVANVGENREPTTAAAAEQVLAAGIADAVSFGRGFLVNPDLPHRLAHGLPWNPMDKAHLYTPGPRGYTDYPAVA